MFLSKQDLKFFIAKCIVKMTKNVICDARELKSLETPALWNKHIEESSL